MTEKKEKPLSQKMFKYTRSGRLPNFDCESVIFVEIIECENLVEWNSYLNKLYVEVFKPQLSYIYSLLLDTITQNCF